MCDFVVSRFQDGTAEQRLSIIARRLAARRARSAADSSQSDDEHGHARRRSDAERAERDRARAALVRHAAATHAGCARGAELVVASLDEWLRTEVRTERESDARRF